MPCASKSLQLYQMTLLHLQTFSACRRVLRLRVALPIQGTNTSPRPTEHYPNKGVKGRIELKSEIFEVNPCC